MSDDDLLTIPEVCAILKPLSRRTFYRWRETGKAPRCIRLPNNEIRVYRRDLKMWIERHREVTA